MVGLCRYFCLIIICVPAFWFLCYIWFVNTPLELRTTDQITSVLTEIWGLLDSQMAFKMMQPNVVLAIAGLKPMADMSEISPDNNTIQRLPEINEILHKHGIEIYIIVKDNAVDYFGGVISLNGLERVTSLSNFPFMKKFKNTLDFKDFIDWKEEMKKAYQKELDTGNFNSKEIDILGQGIRMGYPDQAILDLLHFYRLDKDKRISVAPYLKIFNEELDEKRIESLKGKEIFVKANLNIPKEYLETSPLPLFSYSYNNKDNEGITNWIHDANEVLDSFYSSEWYRTHRI